MNAVPEKTPVTRKKAVSATKAEAPSVDTAPAESPEEMRARIEAEMREKIEAEVRAKVEAEVNEETKARVIANEARPINAADVAGDPSVPGSMVVHFLEDGLTLLGKVWYRGEELPINPGTSQWDEAHSVLSLDEFQQEERWGKRMFRSGPWRGKGLDEIDFEDLTEAERAQLAKAEQLRRERLGL